MMGMGGNVFLLRVLVWRRIIIMVLVVMVGVVCCEEVPGGALGVGERSPGGGNQVGDEGAAQVWAVAQREKG